MFGSRNKTVMIVGEDMLMLFASNGGKASHVTSMAWDEADFIAKLSGYLQKECKGKPVQILYDMLEQQYKKEIVPHLSMMDKGKYIDRKLKVVFPSNPLRAALFLKGEAEQAAKIPGGDDKGQPYIFASVPDLPQLRNIYEAVKQSQVVVSGFGLLPVEGASLLKHLSGKLRKGPNQSKWVVLLSAHESGGLRQIVIRDGELALTRLTVVSAAPENEVEWGQQVATEFQGTLSYLLRFGYTDSQSMDIVIVHGSDNAAQAFKSQLNIDANILCKPVSELAKMCGLKVPGHSEGYADSLHAAWGSKLSKLKLPMKSLVFGRLINLRKYARIATVAAVLAVLSGAAYAGYVFQDATRTKMSTSTEADNQATLLSQIEEKERSLGDMAGRVYNVLTMLDIHESLKKEGIQSFALVNAVSSNLPQAMRLTELSIKVPSGDDENGGGDAAEMPSLEEGDGGMMDGGFSGDGMAPKKENTISNYVKPNLPSSPYEIQMKIGFRADVDPEEGVLMVNNYKDKIAELLTGYEVEVTQQVANLSKKSEFSESFETVVETNDDGGDGLGGTGNDGGGEDALTATIVIKGEGQ